MKRHPYIVPSLILSLPLWFGMWWIAQAIRSAQPTIELTTNPTTVKIIEKKEVLDGYALPGVRK